MRRSEPLGASIAILVAVAALGSGGEPGERREQCVEPAVRAGLRRQVAESGRASICAATPSVPVGGPRLEAVQSPYVSAMGSPELRGEREPLVALPRCSNAEGEARAARIGLMEGPILVRGRAVDTEGGGALETDGWGPLRIDELDRWPADVLGSEVKVRGSVDTSQGCRITYATWAELPEVVEDPRGAGFLGGEWDEATARAVVAEIDASATTQAPRRFSIGESQPFERSGIPARFIQISEQGESCRHCPGRIGAVIFSKTTDGWTVQGQEHDWLEVGAHGVAPPGTLAKIGPGRFGVAFVWPRSVLASTDVERNVLMIELLPWGYRTVLRDAWVESNSAHVDVAVVVDAGSDYDDIIIGSRRYAHTQDGSWALDAQRSAGAVPLASIPEAMTHSLAWPFSHSVQIEGATKVHRFKSDKPVAEGTYLRFAVSVTDYERHESAESEFIALFEEADPDTGLSYAWDTVLLLDRSVAHLSAPCLFSRENFEILEKNFESAFGNPTSRSVRCTCGRGCKLLGAARPPIE